MSITKEDIDIFKDFYFQNPKILYDYQFENFNNFIDVLIFNEIKKKNTFFETFSEDKKYIYRNKFEFTKIHIKPPIYNNNYLFPEEARKKQKTYSCKIFATVRQYQEKEEIIPNIITKKYIGEEEIIEIAEIPIMVKSKYCTTQLLNNIKHTECKYDPGGYFIVKGNEKVIIGIEQQIRNKILVFKKKDATFKDKITYICQINSQYKDSENIQVLNIKMKKDYTIYIHSVMFNEIPLFIFLRALGILSDKEIFENILYDLNDNDGVNLLKYSSNKNLIDQTLPESETNYEIRTQEDAILYLINKLKYNKQNVINTNEEFILKQKKIYIHSFLKNNFLPHLDRNMLKKGKFLCLMINKLVNVYLKRLPEDNRDRYINKRIELPGNLLFTIFKQYYKKMMNEINRYFKKKNYPYPGNENPINVLNQIKPGIIYQELVRALMTGNWTVIKKKGISQPVERIQYVSSMGQVRRISQKSGNDPTTNNVTSIRHIKEEQIFFICPVETSEGAPVGLNKNMSLTASVTSNYKYQNPIILNLINKYIIENIKSYEIKNYIKVFLNGEWLGISKEYNKIIDVIKEAKIKSIIHNKITAILNINELELNIYSDNGRLIRPIFRVKNNKIYLTKEIIEDIKSKDKSSVQTWDEFIIKYPKVIEYIDIDTANKSMIAMTLNDMKIEDIKSNTIIVNPEIYGNKVNRYNNVYVRYDYCEIHPSLYLGLTSSNIPFPEHNCGPRNVYNYSQMRAAVGVYATNERFRMDITYRLMFPQIPIVLTQSMKYLKTINMPAGENCIVAISTYSGYNQEDSVIINKTSLDRGLFRTFVIKDYHEKIIKNPNTSQDDVFTKPERDKVLSMKDSNYDKLNDEGYVPLETEIDNNDIIIGIVSPIKPGNNFGKIYKDKSTSYKGGEKGKINKVNFGIINTDGSPMCNMETRSERVPVIGDKVCSRAGQKGTIGIILHSNDMPFTSKGIQPDIIINPNAIPSRMTIGQLLECLTGKLGVLNNSYIDATAFNILDLDKIKTILESYGYNGYGYETMYCGMTGKKINSQIFIGPTYYLRLKQLVQDKIHSRAKGPSTILTRQPSDGRTKDGGLKFGEMERDCMISHGMSQFLKERLVNTSDIYWIHVCSNCGLFASKVIDRDLYTCKLCEINKSEYKVHKIELPYAFKLLVQELQSINILPRIKIERSIYNTI